ncbi:MAG: flavodoxin-dependent (E)-4-hydroxy-3-methylbut-2-enyl-diphosphate synthase [Candidatus Omnitrophica bacterium]|nr:flavodoxin-dependent (E)-4-hydroxy-3-methylbut-2-enyl-diphosphate synthase [Candidatus Omnitrophota bacterium]
MRRKSKVIKVGGIYLGGSYPIVLQSMTKVKTSEIEKTLSQIRELEENGCEIVRIAVRDSQDTWAIAKIKPKTKIPLVADIHFNWKLALEAIDKGIDKIRLNPGNIYNKKQIYEIVKAAKSAGIPIRIGVNTGSLRVKKDRSKLREAQHMVKFAMDYIRVLEKFGFYDMVVSLKASDILTTIEAYRKIARLCDYPLHLGVTATGLPKYGIVKSSIALGCLLLEGIGDTIRVSLTDSPVQEVKVAKAILAGLNIRRFGPEIISCPVCGRCQGDLIGMVRELEKRIANLNFKAYASLLKIAVMGCAVNGPGEARNADIGIALGQRDAVLFEKGKIGKRVAFKDCLETLWRKIRKNYEQSIKV